MGNNSGRIIALMLTVGGGAALAKKIYDASAVILAEELGTTETSGCPRCSVLSMAELDEIFPDATAGNKTALMSAFNRANDKFGMDTCQQKAHFFAQVREEVGTSISVSNGENMNYHVQALANVPFLNFCENRRAGVPNDLAFQYGRIDSDKLAGLKARYNRPTLTTQAANLEMIANIAYADRNGNGDIASGDGWRYRGRGIIQITGKGKYDKINNRIDSDYPAFGIDIDANNINNLNEGTVASMAYWKEYGCQAKAEVGLSRADADAIINIINSGTSSKDRRWGHLQEMIRIFRVNGCIGDEPQPVNTDKAPWLVFAEAEYNTYKGIPENNSPLKERIIDEYHKSTSLGAAHHGKSTEWQQSVPWCASFVNWCFEQTENFKGTNPSGNGSYNSLAFDWTPEHWENGEECEAFVGAVITLTYSHTAFIVGKNTAANKYVYLGGNQGSRIAGQQQIRYGTVTIGGERSICKPKGYVIRDEEKVLPELSVNADGSSGSTR